MQQSQAQQEFDLYINPAKPNLGLYVRKGAGLPDLADPQQWRLSGQLWQSEVPADVLKEIESNGHAFQELGS